MGDAGIRLLAAAGLLALSSAAAGAAERKPWATLADCRYVPHSNNDGDSFHVRCGADAFVLRGPFVVVTRKASAPGRARDPRYYGMVQVGGKGLDEILVIEGLARAKGVAASVPGGEKSRAHAGRLQLLEDQARQQRKGLWAASPRAAK